MNSSTAVFWIAAWCLMAPGPSPAFSSGPQQPAPPREGRPARPPVPDGTATLSGSVTLAASGQPARGARVTAAGHDNGVSRTTETDGLGRFALANLPAGRYSLAASKPGHVTGSYGQTRPGRSGTPIQLADGQRFDARLSIHKGGVLTGTILDEHGEALPNTQVRALRYVLQSGQRTLQPAGSGSTDDRGIYRVFGLQPGDYVVCATPRNTGPQTDLARRRVEIDALRQRAAGAARRDDAAARELTARADRLEGTDPEEEQATGYAPVYYPGTTSPAQAAAITLGAGEEKPAVDFQLQRVPVAQVEGLVVNPTGQPLPNIQLSLVDAAGSLPGVGANNTRASADGHFRLSNVAPGHYTIVAQATLRPAAAPASQNPQPRGPASRGGPQRVYAMSDVSVDGRNVSNIVLTLQPGLTVSGRVVFEGTKQPPPDLSRVRVSLSPATVPSGAGRPFAAPAGGEVDQNGRFTIIGVLPGKYRLTASNGGSGWFLDESIVDGQNTLDFPAEVKPGHNVAGAIVRFGDRQSDLSGTITNERGQPAPDYTIVLYPSDSRYWVPGARRIRSTRPATDGRFTFSGLPPGEYRLAPIFDVEHGAWYDPAFLQQLDGGALRVQIGDGEQKVQNLRISTGGD
jgi:hypothetical protein